jgi:GTP cyclohydrolase I
MNEVIGHGRYYYEMSRYSRPVVNAALFEESHHDIVLVRDIEIYSMCEHHMLPFFGTATAAYVPNGTVIGLSKLTRIAEHYARRLQVQERLATQIAAAVENATAPLGVMVQVCDLVPVARPAGGGGGGGRTPPSVRP